ncbi:FAS1 domain-containing protein [Obelidium mucronatum]|nr:FAS1 domain-containing protein [Obelidium mucronatum]
MQFCYLLLLAHAAAVVTAQSLSSVLTANGATTLLNLVSQSPNVATAIGTFQGTLFAPTDAALASLNPKDYNARQLQSLLAYHVVPNMFLGRTAFSGNTWLMTLEAAEVSVAGSTGSGVFQLSSGLGSVPSNVVSSARFDGGIVHFIDSPLTPPTDVIKIASQSRQLSNFVEAIKVTGLALTVSELRGCTIFAPTNQAFAAIEGIAKSLSKEQLKQVLLMHVIKDQILHSTDLSNAGFFGGLGGANSVAGGLTFPFDGKKVRVSGPGNTAATGGAATVIVPDVLALNGIVLHVIDKVLLPGGGEMSRASEGGSREGKSTNEGKGSEGKTSEGRTGTSGEGRAEKSSSSSGKSGEGRESTSSGKTKEGTTRSESNLVEVLTANKANTLLSLVKEDAPILKALSTFQGTLFAPTDAALAATRNTFAATPFSGTAFLTTLTGDEIQASGSSDTSIQLTTAFGSTPSKVIKSELFSGGIIHFIDTTLMPPTGIAMIAKQANLNALLTALTTAGLVDTVMGLGKATVFAPSDAAFAAVSGATSKLSPEQLKKVLLLHVVPNNMFHSTEFMQAKTIPSIPTAENETLSAMFDGMNVLVRGPGNSMGAKVVTADVLAMNGVIVHVIDAVLLPGAGSGVMLSKSGRTFGTHVSLVLGVFLLFC